MGRYQEKFGLAENDAEANEALGVRIVVYTKENCVQCGATFREMAKNGMAAREADIMQDPEALRRFSDIGISSAPVVSVTVAGDHDEIGKTVKVDHENGSTEYVVGGFRPDVIKAARALVEARQRHFVSV